MCLYKILPTKKLLKELPRFLPRGENGREVNHSHNGVKRNYSEFSFAGLFLEIAPIQDLPLGASLENLARKRSNFTPDKLVNLILALKMLGKYAFCLG